MNTSEQTNTLKRLKDLGVSPWYDNIERRLIVNGALKRLFDTGVLGVTSNPTIFEKAISVSSDYDAKIAEFYAKGLSIQAVYDELTCWDVCDAADLLKPVYAKSAFVDGYVSIEVLPEYAHDAAKTIDYARRIFRKIGRPNIMIKIPATQESFEAVKALIGEGISVNVTLIFSLEHYQRAARAYIEGLEERRRAGGDLANVNSVASVFVSRIDTAVDKKLDEMIKDSAGHTVEVLKGKAAIANCQMIYQSFKDLFLAEDFKSLAQSGARCQRALWASTGTKNPMYSDVKYVDGLVLAQTVNTIPHVTLEAYLDHGNPIFWDEAPQGALAILRKLAQAGIDINAQCQGLQEEGLHLFSASYNKLLSALALKISVITAKTSSSL